MDTHQENIVLKMVQSYLEHDTNNEKIEALTILEDTMCQMLCTIKHDYKFFTPSMPVVFRKSIEAMEIEDDMNPTFGFQAVLRYANNIYNQPWRKEYRKVRTYSGFYEHEVKKHLSNPEFIFGEMGYVSNEADHSLQLDDNICPDRILTVAYDIVSASCEYKIIKSILKELISKHNVDVSLHVILNLREKMVGDSRSVVNFILTEICNNHGVMNRPVNNHHYENVLYHHPNDNHMCLTPRNDFIMEPTHQETYMSHGGGCIANNLQSNVNNGVYNNSYPTIPCEHQCPPRQPLYYPQYPPQDMLTTHPSLYGYNNVVAPQPQSLMAGLRTEINNGYNYNNTNRIQPLSANANIDRRPITSLPISNRFIKDVDSESSRNSDFDSYDEVENKGNLQQQNREARGDTKRYRETNNL